MENSIGTFTKTLASFCNHLQSTCEALKQSVDRRPIPLDSASSTFTQCVNRRVSAASADLNLLDSMSFGTVSFEELLGHCNEVHKQNQRNVAELEDRLKTLGYLPELDIDDCEETNGSTPREFNSEIGRLEGDSDYFAGSVPKCIEEDPLLDESLNLRSLGLSDACLATLALNANGDVDISVAEQIKQSEDRQSEIRKPHQSALEVFGSGEIDDSQKSVAAIKSTISISKDDYESLPSYMKSLTSWEDLVIAVEKMNSSLSKKENREENFFCQDELASLGLGAKGRSYLLLLVRMNRLVVETVHGLISYRVL